jgi:hypothetical protein
VLWYSLLSTALIVNRPLHIILLTKVKRYDKKGDEKCYLYMYNLHWMNCSNGEGGGLLIFVVQFVEVLVEERRMVDAMQPVRHIVLRKNNRILVDAREISAVFHKLSTHCLIYNIKSFNELDIKYWHLHTRARARVHAHTHTHTHTHRSLHWFDLLTFYKFLLI